MPTEKNQGRKTVRRRVITGTNPEGTIMYGWRTFDADEPPTEAELPSKDGTREETIVEGSEQENPPIEAGRTAKEVEENLLTSRVVSGTEKAMPRGDRD